MKLISLNIWGGRIHEPLLGFLKDRQDIDVFCFQEVYRSPAEQRMVDEIYANIFGDISVALPDYEGYYAGSEDQRAEKVDTDFPLEYGQGTFVRKNISVKQCGHDFVHKYKGAPRSEIGFSAARLVQHVHIASGGREYSILNFHGLHNGLGKGDSAERIAQAQKVRALFDSAPGQKILCGDFNLLPDTESMAIMDGGLRNLIKENNIQSTRSSFYKKEHRFADYVIVSPDVQIKEFSVLENEVSDHLPLYLDFI